MPLLLLSGISLAQSTGTIVGTIHDPTSAVLPGVNVTIRNVDTGLTRTLQTDVNGIYSAPLLPVGNYEISAQAQGFATIVRTGVQLLVAQTAQVDFAMKISNVQEKLEVSGDAPLVDTQSVSLGNVEVAQRIEDLPLNKRDFYQLAVLQPGVLPPYANRGSVGVPLAAGEMQSQPEVNGLRESNNYSILDGAFINDPYYNTATVVPNPDAIAEFKMQTNLTSARYGRGAGAVINIVTKSGSNKIHGGAYDFERSDIFDARNYFVSNVPFLQRQQFGANVGGPIKTDKSFFFVSYEGLRQREGDPMTATVPSMQDRSGNLSDQPSGIINPFTGLPFGGPENFDPTLINPLAQKVLDLYPIPNDGLTTWSGAPLGGQGSDQGIVRWDQTLSQRQSLGARYIFQRQTALKNFNQFAFSGPVDTPGFPERDKDVTSNIVVWDTFATTKLVNDLRFAYQRNTDVVGRPTNPLGHYGFGFTFPQAGDAAYGDVFPQLGLGGYSSIGNADGDVFRTYSVFQVQDTITFNHGKHSIALGGEINRMLLDSKAYFVRMGVYYFLGYESGNPVADMLLGMPSLFADTLGDPSRDYRSTGLNGFFEDTYHLRPGFTVTLGMRYELQTAPIETDNRLAMFSPANAAAGVISTLHPEAPPGMVFSGDPGFPRSLVPTRKKNFGPRVGFAWDVFGNGKTSLRSGYGIFYDQAPIMAYVDSSLNPPQSPLYYYSPNPFAPNVMSNPVVGISYIPQTQAQADTPGTQVPPLPNMFGPGITNVSPYVEQWNLSIERAVTSDLGLTVAYVGNSGTHLLGTVDANQPQFIPGNTNALNAQQRRPYPLYSLNFDHMTGFSSNYNALQVSANKRLRHGVGFVASYTWSKTIDYDSQSLTYFHIQGQPVLPQNTFDLHAERGLSAFDVPQRLVISGTWQFPGFDKRQEGLARLIGGWELSGIFSANSGFPFTVVDSLNPSFTEEYGPTDRPNLVGNPNAGPHTVAKWFNTGAFQALSPGDGFGDAGRNIVRGPGIQNLDLSLAKNIDLREPYRLQFRAEFFNALNHANFLPPINDIASPNFGQITQTSTDNREMQFGLKFIF
jgi:hypothetical protein